MHVGGIQNQLMHLLRNTDKERFQIDFTTDMDNPFYKAEIEQLGAVLYRIPKMRISNPFPYCKALFSIMKQGNYDIVHSHELFHSGIVLALAYLAGVKCRIAHAHNWEDRDDPSIPRGGIRTTYNTVMRCAINIFSTSKIACSTWAAKFLYGSGTRKNCHIVHNSVDVSKFLDNYGNIETGDFVNPEWINILHVGRITPVKNQEFLMEVAKILKDNDCNIRILCVGDGEKKYVDELKAKIKEYKLDQHMYFLGIRDDVDCLMRKASAFVLPSKFEGMPLVLIEAQASGLPCIVASTFSKEVDFGIGSVEWMNTPPDDIEWVKVIKIAITRERKSKEQIERAIFAKKFASKDFAREIMQIYELDYRKSDAMMR